MYRGGLQYMRYSISDTAEYGDYTAGARIVTAETKATMRQMLKEIQSGEFAKKWIAENENGLAELQADARGRSQSPDRESSASSCATMMPFLDPVTAAAAGDRVARQPAARQLAAGSAVSGLPAVTASWPTAQLPAT